MTVYVWEASEPGSRNSPKAAIDTSARKMTGSARCQPSCADIAPLSAKPKANAWMTRAGWAMGRSSSSHELKAISKKHEASATKKIQKPVIERIVSSPGGAWFWENYRHEFEESFRKEVDQLLRAIT